MLEGVTGILQSIDFAFYPEGYILFGKLIYLETVVETRKPVVTYNLCSSDVV